MQPDGLFAVKELISLAQKNQAAHCAGFPATLVTSAGSEAFLSFLQARPEATFVR
jgi:hypothetical protein